MFGKRLRIVFIIAFLGMIAVPLLTTNLQEGKISDAENRTLASFPSVYNDDGTRNKAFNTGFETWLNDNIGMRSQMVVNNAKIQYYMFNVLSNNSDMCLGPDGELNYATPEIFKSYQHLDLKTEETLDSLAESYQYAKEYLDKKGIQFYYFQCWDKQSIYPEYFPKTVIQYGDVSKTDQIVETLFTRTDINVISPKEELIAGKKDYDTYSKWGDPTHWTQRGAFIGYRKLMDAINKNNGNIYKVLQEKDYNITMQDLGSTLFGGIHKECILENFEIKAPDAELTNEKLTLYSGDQRHVFYTNETVANNTRLLVLGDSYINSFIIDDLAESFHETFIIRGDYISGFEQIIDEYNPDIVIVENAERCDRSDGMISAMQSIQQADRQASMNRQL